jgi:Superinfection immunity protein
MVLDSRVLMSAAALIAAALYLLPTVIAVARRAVSMPEVIALNIALGWTGAAWLVALILALGPRRPAVPVAPPTRPIPRPSPPRRSDVYRDGWYILSSGPESATWAVCELGRWQIVYELSGRQRLVGPVPDTDVPMAVLAEALAARETER